MLRKGFEILPGDKLLVMGNLDLGRIVLMKGDVFAKLMEEFEGKIGKELKEGK